METKSSAFNLLFGTEGVTYQVVSINSTEKVINALKEMGIEEKIEPVETHLNDKTGVARFKVYLEKWRKYSIELENNPDLKCNFICKNIRHNVGQNKIDSKELGIKVFASVAALADHVCHHRTKGSIGGGDLTAPEIT